MTIIYTESLPAKTWREIARQTTNPEFKAQIIEELNDHSANDTLRIRVDHIIEQQPPARPDGDVTIVLSRKQAETASFAARYTASHLRHYPKDAELMNAITTVIEAALAAAHDRPGGEEADE